MLEFSDPFSDIGIGSSRVSCSLAFSIWGIRLGEI